MNNTTGTVRSIWSARSVRNNNPGNQPSSHTHSPAGSARHPAPDLHHEGGKSALTEIPPHLNSIIHKADNGTLILAIRPTIKADELATLCTELLNTTLTAGH